MTYLLRVHLPHPTRANGTYCALQQARDAPRTHDPDEVTCRRCRQGWAKERAEIGPKVHLAGELGPACNSSGGAVTREWDEVTCKRCVTAVEAAERRKSS